jgi:hypothetical protein
MGYYGSGLFIRTIALLSILISLFLNLSCKGKKTETSESRTNSPPVITSVIILPEKPNKENELDINIQSQDPDRDPIAYSYQWVKNDEEMVDENKNILKSGNFRKGDIIQVKVTPSDGKVNGKAFLSPPVRILNSPPIIQEVRIEPKAAYASDPLRAVIKSSDVDGDFTYYTYQWEKNGTLLPEERAEVLEPGGFKKGDSITVTVTPDDREVQGKSKKSDLVIISNSPPIIVSSPPTSIEGTTYLYSVKVNDPDNDPILFTLKSGPKGMEMDKKTGLIRWEIRKEDKGTYPIEIEASDNEGAKSLQRYTVTVEFK